jgi:hypothetical protein
MEIRGPGIPEQRDPGPSGFKILLYVLLGLGVLGVLTCGSLFYLGWRDPAVRQFVETMVGSQSAPGTEQLREAGCVVAQVFDFASALAIFSQFDVGESSQAEAVRDLTMVQCVLSSANEDALGCDEVARIYASAVEDPPERFLVQVLVQRSTAFPCRMVYAADATPIAPLDDYLAEAPAAEPR